MRYMLLCYDDGPAWENAGKEAHQAAMKEAVQLTHELDAKGQYILASPLHPTSTAASVAAASPVKPRIASAIVRGIWHRYHQPLALSPADNASATGPSSEQAVLRRQAPRAARPKTAVTTSDAC